MKRLLLFTMFISVSCSAMLKKIFNKSSRLASFYSFYNKKDLIKMRQSVFRLVAERHVKSGMLANLAREDVQRELAEFSKGTITDYGKLFQSTVQTIAAEYGLQMPDCSDNTFKSIEEEYACHKAFHKIKGLFDNPKNKKE